MPKKLHPFQRELQERSNDKARIERELKLRQRIYKFAELLSDKERKRRFACLIAEKQLAAQRQTLSDDEELDRVILKSPATRPRHNVPGSKNY